MQFVTNSFITVFQTTVLNSGLYYFPNIYAHLYWENDNRVRMQNTLIIRRVVTEFGDMLLSGVPKTFPFCQSATNNHL